MEETINLCYSKISIQSDIILTATQLRSYLGYRFISDTEFHHHDDKPYHYPLIQYKRIKNTLYVIGILDYSKLVFNRMSGLQYIVLAKKNIPITNITFENTKHRLSNEITSYSFTSPWIALNTENYTKFKKIDHRFKKKFLEDILTGNILSMLKGLNIRINYKLYVNIDWYKEVPIIAHKHDFSGFYANFITNLSLPKYIGLGKSVSKGFGTIQKQENKKKNNRIIGSKINDKIIN